ARIYKDSVLVREAAIGVYRMRTNLPLVVGARHNVADMFYQGLLDEITFYTRPLSITEITAIYQAGAAGKTPPDDNLPPVVSAGPDAVIASTADIATLAGSVVDDDRAAGA